MGAIQSALNGAIGSAAVVVGAGKHIKQQAEISKQQADLIEQGRKTQESVKNMVTPNQFMSAAAKAYDQNKGAQAMMAMDFNKKAKFAQTQDFSQRLEASKNIVKASRKNIKGGKK